MSNSETNPALAVPAPVGPLPGARPALLLLIFINLFNYIDRYVLAAVVPYLEKIPDFIPPNSIVASWQNHFLHTFGFKPKMALLGMLGMAFMVVYTIAAPIFGRLAERKPRWVLIGIGVVLWSLASGASGLAATFMILLCTRLFVGVGEAAYGPVAPSVISDFYPVNIRGQVLAWFYMAIPVGSALGFVLGDMVAGLSPNGWRWAFYCVVPPGLLLGCLAFLRREPPRGQADLATIANTPSVAWKDYLILIKTPSYVLCTLGMSAMTFAMGGISYWMPYYLETRLGDPKGPTSLFGVILVVSGLSGTLLGGIVGDKMRGRVPGSYFLCSGLAMLAGFPIFLGVLRAPFPWAWLLIFLACFTLFFNTGPTNTILANVSHPSMRAAAFALNIFVIHSLGDVISPVIIGILTDKYNIDTAFLVVGAMILVSGIFWLLGTGFLARDTALAPNRLAQSARDA